MSKTSERGAAKSTTSVPEERPMCFVIMPLDTKDSAIRRASVGLLKNVIEPVVDAAGYRVVPPHEMEDLGSITRQVITKIINAKLVIANLTGLNPNVMYELAIRHAKAKPVICMAEEGTRLPFDVIEERTVFYANDLLGGVEVREELRRKVESASKEERSDNPIVRAIQTALIDEAPDLSNIEKVMFNMLMDVRSRVVVPTAPSLPRGLTDAVYEVQVEGDSKAVTEWYEGLMDIAQVVEGKPTTKGGYSFFIHLPESVSMRAESRRIESLHSRAIALGLTVAKLERVDLPPNY